MKVMVRNSQEVYHWYVYGRKYKKAVVMVINGCVSVRGAERMGVDKSTLHE